MADVREVFPILADVSGVGVDVAQMQEGWSPVAQNGLIGFSFKDSSGNVVLPTLLPDGKIAVSTQSPGTPKMARGELLGGSLTVADVTGAVITLTATKKYSELAFFVSCRRGSLFQVIWNDNGSETVLADVILDSGQYTFGDELPNLIFTAGATGTQELKVKAKNFDKVSDMRATLAILEVA